MGDFFAIEDEPSLGVSLIPVVGSGKEAAYQFHEGNYVRGLFWSAMAVTDIFLVKAIVVSGLKLTGVMSAKVIGTRLGKLTAQNSKTVVAHLTNVAGEAGIKQSQKITGRFGVYGLEASKVPANTSLRQIITLVPKDLSKVITISGEAANAFSKPPAFGVFSTARRMANHLRTPLGTIDLKTGKFIADEIFRAGGLRAATAGERAAFYGQRFMLDYGVDSIIYLGAKANVHSGETCELVSETLRLK